MKKIDLSKSEISMVYGGCCGSYVITDGPGGVELVEKVSACGVIAFFLGVFGTLGYWCWNSVDRAISPSENSCPLSRTSSIIDAVQLGLFPVAVVVASVVAVIQRSKCCRSSPPTLGN